MPTSVDVASKLWCFTLSCCFRHYQGLIYMRIDGDEDTANLFVRVNDFAQLIVAPIS